MIVFPELSVTGYEGGARFAQMAQRVPWSRYEHSGPACHRFWRVCLDRDGGQGRGVETVLYNGAVLIAPDGEVAGTYRKVHLPAEERLSSRPGYQISPLRPRSVCLVS